MAACIDRRSYGRQSGVARWIEVGGKIEKGGQASLESCTRVVRKRARSVDADTQRSVELDRHTVAQLRRALPWRRNVDGASAESGDRIRTHAHQPLHE